MEKVFETRSERETEKLGESLGRLLERGDFIALSGDLGAGKTAFARGVARGIGINEDITSPTFTIINEYDGILPLAHMDVYRLKSVEELANVGFDDYLEGFVVVMEWAEKVKEMLPQDLLWVEIEAVDEKRRKISLKSNGKHYDKILQELNL
jgi:tRNA threonylcarbamoyladenosine biosynthesis protein TsaE